MRSNLRRASARKAVRIIDARSRIIDANKLRILRWPSTKYSSENVPLEKNEERDDIYL
jgi:hypothetical protein